MLIKLLTTIAVFGFLIGSLLSYAPENKINYILFIFLFNKKLELKEGKTNVWFQVN